MSTEYKYKYHTYTDEKNRIVTVAISTYEGKTVKGYAKCHVNDTYDENIGRELAAARCNEKIAKKRAKRAEKKLNEALNDALKAKAYVTRMFDYLEDAKIAADEAKYLVKQLYEKL